MCVGCVTLQRWATVPDPVANPSTFFVVLSNGEFTAATVAPGFEAHLFDPSQIWLLNGDPAEWRQRSHARADRKRHRHLRGVHPRPMNEQLPPTYQRVKALLDAGASTDEIADRIGVDPSAVPALIELTMAKAARADDARPERSTE